MGQGFQACEAVAKTKSKPFPEGTGGLRAIGQLGTKDKQIARKDTQLDNTFQRNGELNVLLQGYQKRLGALPPPTDIREHVTRRNGRRTHHQRPVTTLATTVSSVLT